MNIYVIAAIIPIVALCSFIYFKDKNKEPNGLLALIFFLGFVSVFPILICELVFDFLFSLDTSSTAVIPTFLKVFFGVALFEEGFKWLISKFVGYNNKDFDEVFDIIVYSVFASLGFACFENILYVLQNGLGNAVTRALLAIPGHTCFAISMGYYLSKAKVGQINGNHKIYVKNTLLSIFIPMVLHTFYDGLLMIVDARTYSDLAVQMLPFMSFYLVMVIACFITVDKTAKVQQNLSLHIKNGSIARNKNGILYYNYQKAPVQAAPAVQSASPNGGFIPDRPVSIPTPVVTQTVDAPQTGSMQKELSFCPICGRPARGLNYCGRCGFKLK